MATDLHEAVRLLAIRAGTVARETSAQRDVQVALVLEAVAHMLGSDSRRGAALANAAGRYLLPVRDRLRHNAVEMQAAADWTDELRAHIVDAIERVELLRRQEAQGVNVEPRIDGLAQDIARAVAFVVPRERTSDHRETLSKIRSAIATETDVETVLHAVLAAIEISSADVNRLTKAKYQSERRSRAKKRPKRATK